MDTFAPGDRVVAINTDLSRPIGNPKGWPLSAFSFPDGPLRRAVVYHVVGTVQSRFGRGQGLIITGLQVLLNDQPIPWDSSRFRKVDSLKGHTPGKRRRKRGVPGALCVVPGGA